MTQRYVKVRLLDAPFFLDRDYDYSVPADMADAVAPGAFVTVPFGGGNRRRIGLVRAFTEQDPDIAVTKPLFSVIMPDIALSAEMLGLVFFLCENTLCTAGDAVHAMLPAGALSAFAERYRVTDRAADMRRLSDVEAFLLGHVRTAGETSAEALRARFGKETDAALRRLVRAGLLSRELVLRTGMAEAKTVYFSRVEGAAPPARLGAKQKALWDLLGAGERTEEDLRAAGCGKAQTDALLEKGLIARREERRYRDLAAEGAGNAAPIALNEEQQAAYDRLTCLADDGAAHAALLYGVTGSGKTQVMLKTIDRMLEKGRGVIVLLPEIALTPQSLAIFCARYGARVAVMHSGLSAGERLDAYHRVLSGKADVVVGTRSAVFAPVKNLGLIVMDEEHEHTYKSDQNPKYHARDVARYRCAQHGALLLLCSATPSLESYKRALEGRYTLLTLKHRHAGATLPRVLVADMRGESAGGNLSPIGAQLENALRETAAAGDQAILFLNRRGYHHAVTCRSCGAALTCPACSVSLTYHTNKGTYREGYLLCHLCGRRLPVPTVCPACGSEHLGRFGYGTQRVEEELGTLLPAARVLRMDTDTTTTRHAYDEMLGRFRRHEADVLLGTQMVTKGHDFPDVTLVGVLMADAALYLDDYRAAERTFSMLTQVVGRAGRAEKAGVAVIQTNNPDHEVIRLACAQDFEAFYAREIKLRRMLTFPPFCDIALFTLSHANEQILLSGGKRLTDELTTRLASTYHDVQLIAFGPFEAPVYRAEGRYRLRVVVKCRLNAHTRALFREVLTVFSAAGTGAPLLSVDFNPSNL